MNEETIKELNDRLQSAGSHRAEISYDGRYLFWIEDSQLIQADMKDGKEVSLAAVPEESGFCCSRNSEFVAVVSDVSVCVYSLDSKELVVDVGIEQSVTIPPGSFSLSPGATHLIAKSTEGPEWKKIKLPSGETTTSFRPPADDEAESCAALSPNAGLLALAGIKGPVSGGFLAVFDTDTGELLLHETSPYEVDAVAISDGSEPDAVAITDRRGVSGDGWTFEDPYDEMITDLRVIRGGEELLGLTYGGELFCLNAANGSLLNQVNLPVRNVLGISAPQDPKFVVLRTKQGARLVVTEL